MNDEVVVRSRDEEGNIHCDVSLRTHIVSRSVDDDGNVLSEEEVKVFSIAGDYHLHKATPILPVPSSLVLDLRELSSTNKAGTEQILLFLGVQSANSRVGLVLGSHISLEIPPNENLIITKSFEEALSFVLWRR